MRGDARGRKGTAKTTNGLGHTSMERVGEGRCYIKEASAVKAVLQGTRLSLPARGQLCRLMLGKDRVGAHLQRVGQRDARGVRQPVLVGRRFAPRRRWWWRRRRPSCLRRSSIRRGVHGGLVYSLPHVGGAVHGGGGAVHGGAVHVGRHVEGRSGGGEDFHAPS